VEYWHHYAGTQLEAATKKVFDSFQAKYPNIDFQPTLITNADYMAKVTAASQTGSLPDVILLAVSRFKDVLGMGALVDITDRINALPNFSDYPTGIFNAESAGGKLYGMPAHSFPDGNLFYRADWLQEAGFSAPPKNLDEFLAVAQKMTDPSKNRFGFGLRAGDDLGDLLEVIESYGPDLVDANGKITMDRDLTIAAVTYWAQLYSNKLSPTSATSDGLAQIEAGFGTGQTGMVMLGFGALGDIQKQATFPADALGVTVMPGKTRASCWTAPLCNAMVSPRNADASWAWMSYWNDPQVQASFYLDVGFIPPFKAALAVPEVASSPHIDAALAAVSEGHLGPTFAGYDGWMKTTLVPNFQAVLAGSMTPTQFTDEAITALKTAVG
jgi:multiple sugar transport system substrate-binding protein